jgi:hypothetical protein
MKLDWSWKITPITKPPHPYLDFFLSEKRNFSQSCSAKRPKGKAVNDEMEKVGADVGSSDCPERSCQERKIQICFPFAVGDHLS